MRVVKKLKGKVIKHNNNKTATILIERLKQHPLYRKKYKYNKKIVIHDPENTLKIGDIAEIIPSRPFSKTKRWILARKI